MAAGQAVRLIEVSVGSVTFHLGNGALVLSILGIKLDDPCKKLTWYRARIWYSLSVHGYYVLLSLLPTSDIQSRPPGCPGLLGSAGTMPLRLMRACPPPPAQLSFLCIASEADGRVRKPLLWSPADIPSRNQTRLPSTSCKRVFLSLQVTHLSHADSMSPPDPSSCRLHTPVGGSAL